MYHCYELDIDIAQVRYDLTNMYLRNNQEYAVLEYRNDWFGDAISPYVRFMTLNPDWWIVTREGKNKQGGYLHWHMDINGGFTGNSSYGNNTQAGKTIPAVVNILLTEPDPTNYTEWGMTQTPRLYDTEQHSLDYELGSSEFDVLDRFCLGERAVLFDTSTFHRVPRVKQKRVIAGFCVWPLYSFSGMVHWCRANNYLIER